MDKAFDSVEATIDAHQEEAAVIIERLGNKMSKIVEHHKNMTVPAAWEMLEVVKEETGRLHEVAVKAVTRSPVASSTRESVRMIAVEAAEKAKELVSLILVAIEVGTGLNSSKGHWGICIYLEPNRSANAEASDETRV